MRTKLLTRFSCLRRVVAAAHVARGQPTVYGVALCSGEDGTLVLNGRGKPLIVTDTTFIGFGSVTTAPVGERSR